MTEDQLERPLNRRVLLRGGAVVAGAAGVAAISSLAPSKASASAVNYIAEGVDNPTTATTGVTIGDLDGSDSAALALTNASGPALLLTPVGDGYDGELQLGEIANRARGPEIGVNQGDGVETTWLATGLDLDEIPFNFPIPPERLLDTRTAPGRESIQTTSTDAFDSEFRLKAGAWMDVGIIPSNYIGLLGVYVNVTAVKPITGGYLTAYPPGERPLSSTINFIPDQTIANGAFIACGIAEEEPGWIVIRIFSTAVMHVVLDLTGVTVQGVSGLSNDAKAGSAKQRKAAKTDRMKRVFG